MRKMNRIILLLTALAPAALSAQIGSLSPVLVGSTGNFSISGSLMLSSSTGEVIVPTSSAPTLILTQGFQQPSANGALALNAALNYANVSCAGSADGAATMTTIGGTAPYSYAWSSSPNDTLATNDSLAPGSYTVTVTDAAGLSVTQSFTILDGTGICNIHIYSGLTPNGDGHNDAWVIDYLDLFQPNTVAIYNRWGVEVWNGVNYDNSTVVWTGHDLDGNALPDGTYYYVVTYDGQSSKGWVELSH